MAGAHVNADEMRRFNTELRRFIEDEFELLHRLRHRAQALGETWRDAQYMRLLDSFDQTTKVLEKFLADADDLLPYLENCEADIRSYESRGL